MFANGQSNSAGGGRLRYPGQHSTPRSRLGDCWQRRFRGDYRNRAILLNDGVTPAIDEANVLIVVNLIFVVLIVLIVVVELIFIDILAVFEVVFIVHFFFVFGEVVAFILFVHLVF